jgi:hypothetical protein
MLLQTLSHLRDQLALIHPSLPLLLIAGVVGMILYCWRRFAPASFESLPKPIQALLPTLIGALIGGASASDLTQMIQQAFEGAFVGLTAMGGHEFLLRMPGPYTGGSVRGLVAQRRKSEPPEPPSETPTRPNWQIPSNPPANDASGKALFCWVGPFALGAAMAACIWCIGCSPSQWQTQVKVAQDTARILDVSDLALRLAYESEEAKAAASGGSPEAQAAALAAVRQSWEPIWLAAESARNAQSAWQRLVSSGGQDVMAAAADARDAYCGLKLAVRPHGINLPGFPGLACGN